MWAVSNGFPTIDTLPDKQSSPNTQSANNTRLAEGPGVDAAMQSPHNTYIHPHNNIMFNLSICTSLESFTRFHEAFPFANYYATPTENHTAVVTYDRFQVLPFALQGSPVEASDNVTITTQLSENRLDILNYLMTPLR
jgi:hypothetical protein